MHTLKLFFLLFLLNTGKQIVYQDIIFTSENFCGNNVGMKYSEGIQISSPVHLTRIAEFSIDSTHLPHAILFKEKIKGISESISYDLPGNFPDTGFSAVDIIFPFHTFL